MRSSKPPLQVFVELFWMDSMVGFDVGWKLFELRRFMKEKLVSKWQNLPFLGNPAKWYRYHSPEQGWYRYQSKWYRYHYFLQP